MVRQIGPGMAEVNIKEMGTNCLKPCRFIKDDGRCDRVFACSYPERQQCQAVEAEVIHLMKEQTRLINVYVNIDHTIHLLQNMLKK